MRLGTIPLLAAVLALSAGCTAGGPGDTDNGVPARAAVSEGSGANSIPEIWASEGTPLLRTDFTDDAAWRTITTQVALPVPIDEFDEDPWPPHVVPIADREFDGTDGAALATRFAGVEGDGYVLLADSRAMGEARQAGTEITLAYVDLSSFSREVPEEFNTFPGRTFRTTIPEIASIEANLAIANMDFFEFADNVQPDGVFRGFEGE